MTPDQLEQYLTIRKVLESGSIEPLIPKHYKSYFNAAKMAIEKANELKKKKDELQLASIRAAVDMMIKEDEVTKDQCQDMVKKAMTSIGKEEYFS